MTDLPIDTHHGRSFKPLASGARVLVVTSPALVRALLLHEYEGRPDELKILDSALVGTMDAVQANPAHGVFEGVVTATHPERSKIGLHLLQTDIGVGSVPFLETEEAITAALTSRFEKGGAMPAVRTDMGQLLAEALGADFEGFEKEHPWLRRIGLSDGERSGIVGDLTDMGIAGALTEMFETEAEADAYVDELPELKAEIEALGDDEEKQYEHMIKHFRGRMMLRPSPTFHLAFPNDEGHRCMLQEAFRSVISLMETARDHDDAHSARCL